MTAAEASVKQGGVIIMLSRSDDGTGGDHFYHQLADEADLGRIMMGFLNRARNETLPDQWQSQILVRILMHAHVVFISSLDDKTVEELHMIPAHSIDEALEIARGLVGKQDLTVTAIPDGISVIVR
jgi:nickel-dependent lactate racemase